jgi:hypothetical protein
LLHRTGLCPEGKQRDFVNAILSKPAPPVNISLGVSLNDIWR